MRELISFEAFERNSFSVLVVRPVEENSMGLKAFFEMIPAKNIQLWLIYVSAGVQPARVVEELGLAAILGDKDRMMYPKACIHLNVERKKLFGMGDLLRGAVVVVAYTPSDQKSLSSKLISLYAFLQPRFQALIEYMRLDVRFLARKERLFAL